MSNDKKSDVQLSLPLKAPKSKLYLIQSNSDNKAAVENPSSANKKLYENALSRVAASGVFNISKK